MTGNPSPLSWEGKYALLRKAYDENRKALEALADKWDDPAEVSARLAELLAGRFR
jgi:hypothetical protein